MLLYIFVQIGIFVVVNTLKFENITYDIFPMNSGIIAAFGHVNSDEYTDVFSLQQRGNKLQLFMGNEVGQQFQPQFNCTFETLITGVVPGDFNGDAMIDILITLINSSSTHDVKILWGNDGNFECKPTHISNIVNQPLIVDFDGDMIPDIIGEAPNGERFVLISSTKKTFTKISFNSTQKFANPHSSGLIDINDDLAADILIMGEEDIEVWINMGTNFTKNDSILYPLKKNSDHGRLQSTFVDLNLDGKMDLIMPICHDKNCDNSVIMVLNSSSEWELLLDNFKYQNITWGFKLPKADPLDMSALPVTLRAGDVDMDGYPDFIAVLQSKSPKPKSKLVIIKNNPCSSQSHCVYDRSLEVIWDVPGLDDIPNIEIAAFFDIFEDGVLDILASSKDQEKHEWKIHALKNSEIVDSCFMKVLVLSGLCTNCSSLEHMPYGVNQPGPLIQYKMTKQDGHPLSSSAVQNSQTAYFPLHLPYSMFGLGQTPNFIDSLTVAVPAKFNKNVHKHEWTQIIPNSQIVVIPHPPEDESKWVRKLFVTPSHYVLLTGIALLGTCAFIALLVALLHLKERKEDKKEKMQDAYRFHFDAM